MIAEAARCNNLQAVIGVSEKDGGTLYMGQWHYSAQGEVISRRRKLKPTLVERAVFGEGDGSDMMVSDTELGRVGALCCWEHLQPLSKFAMYSQQEQIHVAAWPAYSVYVDRSYALSPELSIAANQISACSVISPKLQELLCDTDEKRALIKVGGGYSQVFGPDGAPLADFLNPEEEGLVVADIDLNKIAFCKAAVDPVGHYSRPDVFRLMFNRKPAPVVVPFDESADQDSDLLSSDNEESPTNGVVYSE